MIISMENAQDKIELGEYLEQRLQDGLNAVAKLHELDDMTEVDITIVDDEGQEYELEVLTSVEIDGFTYLAVILAGLRVLESHAHSLPVSYVAPSFDAMVNSSFADLKFINNTKNPVYLTAEADDERIKINVFGEPMNYKVLRISKIIDKIMENKYAVVKVVADGGNPEGHTFNDKQKAREFLKQLWKTEKEDLEKTYNTEFDISDTWCDADGDCARLTWEEDDWTYYQVVDVKSEE